MGFHLVHFSNLLDLLGFSSEFRKPEYVITTPNRELLTATDMLQCGVDSSHRLHYVGFQEMRKVE